MYYDPEQNAMVDVETGALIPLTEGDEIPADLRAEVRGTTHIRKQIQQKKDFSYARTLQNDPSDLEHHDDNTACLTPEQQIQRDHDMALALSLSSETSSPSSSVAPSSSVPVFLPPSQQQQHSGGLEMEREQRRREQEAADHALALTLSGGGGPDLPPRPPSSRQLGTSPYYSPEESCHRLTNGDIELMQPASAQLGAYDVPERGLESAVARGGWGGWMDDLSLARALQAMEFEIASEMRGGRAALSPEEEAFHRKEGRAMKCKRQLVTVSSFICLIQIGLLVAMIQDDGYASKTENPMYGPRAYTLVRYGAKVAALIKYDNEWWRLVTPIFLHAGIIHIISNVGIQLRVGGYLELVFGRASWLFIYFSSGIYGNMLSCIFLPDSVGIGSSGAVLGMLSAWIVWILFRWGKVPSEHRGNRNCQLLVVTAAVVLTLAFSFTDFVDWAAHFGGAIQGVIGASLVLSRELEQVYLRWGVRVLSAVCFVVSYTWALVYMLEVLRPSKEFLSYYEENDDWGR